ncbi:hypothetical protein IQ254_18710 [Nodosilinea sp. LEGE 07088]|uniref:hypothetical protein n=1 Tax=Nodosilinea sp. LEGE 07088 TaxID=2777968 RepID=UPI00187DF0E7|nr:hypothetical protein [Nodosilinea sp. LEGE 07088]MBE9139202.1 hypothetical protein [Nodosilinea sp. LEGE 07088]
MNSGNISQEQSTDQDQQTRRSRSAQLRLINSVGGAFFVGCISFLIWEMSLDIQREILIMKLEIEVHSISIQGKLLQNSSSGSVEEIENGLAQTELLEKSLLDNASYQEELVGLQTGIVPEPVLVVGAAVGAGLACIRA